MVPISRRLSAAAAIAISMLMLSACGGKGGSESNDGIDGAKKTGKSGSPPASSSASAPEDPDAPEFDFPKGAKVVIADELTGDKRKDEVLRDHGYSLRANVLAYAKGDPELPVAYQYIQDSAGEYLRQDVKKVKGEGQVATGTYRYYDREVEMKGAKGAIVRFCESQRDAYGKVVKTGKVLRGNPSVKDFTSVQDIMQKRGEAWRLVSSAVKEGDQKCAR